MPKKAPHIGFFKAHDAKKKKNNRRKKKGTNFLQNKEAWEVSVKKYAELSEVIQARRQTCRADIQSITQKQVLNKIRIKKTKNLFPYYLNSWRNNAKKERILTFQMFFLVVHWSSHKIIKLMVIKLHYHLGENILTR